MSGGAGLPLAASRVDVRPATKDDPCDLSTCRQPARYWLGWVYPPADEPRAWHAYCTGHGRVLLPANHPLRGTR